MGRRMRWSRPWLVLAALVLTASRASAHPVPFSYLDVRLEGPRLDGTLVLHAFDLAHDLQIDRPERLLEETVVRQDSVITGHSTVMPWAGLAQYAQFNKDFLADVRTGVTAGKTPDEIAAASKLAEKYTGYTLQPARLKSNVEAVAAEIKK